MDFVQVTAGKDDDGRRVDRVMRKFLSEQALSRLYQAIRTGLIRINGKKCTPDSKITSGMQITIAAVLVRDNDELSTAASVQIIQDKLPPVIYNSPDLLAINKPYDIPVQPSAGSPAGTSLAEIIPEGYSLNAHTGSLSFRSGPLHRLDRKTTGVLFFSRSLAGAQWFSATLKTHQIHKYYIALLQGIVQKQEQWQDLISKKTVPGNSSLFHTVTISERPDDGQSADTSIHPLAYGTCKDIPVTLAQIEIKTGRTHQIRAQAAYHGYPLLGDTAYGGQKITGPQDFYLHAYEIHFPRPNPVNTPSVVRASISTNFEKMLTVTLIKWDGTIIL